MSEAATPAKTRYKTRNWAQYNAALKERGSLTIWLDRDMQWLATPSGKRGRQQIFYATCNFKRRPIRPTATGVGPTDG